jgi:hypothetical protein
MKKLLLGFALITSSAAGLMAQSGVVIQHDGVGANLAGGAFETTMYATHPDVISGVYVVHFVVTNNTGADKQWRITRKKITAPTTWSDQVCWPPLCYTPTGDLYTTPSTSGNPAPTILNNSSDAQTSSAIVLAELKPQITMDVANYGYAHYRYYINEGGQYIDSVDLKINFTLGISPLKQNPAMTVSPNPASDNMYISLASVDNANVKVVDVLGNVVMNETISNGSKNVDVSSFKNGVYFVIVEAPGIKPMNRKLIIRH